MNKRSKNNNIKRPHIKYDPEILDKFYQKKCSPEEMTMVEYWFSYVDHAKEIHDRAKTEWEYTNASGENKEYLQNVLYKIHYLLNTKREKEEKDSERSIWIKKIMTVAAISILLITVSFWMGNSYYLNMNNKMYTKLYAPYGSRIRFELPDGSKGWLNSGSSLKYPVRFTEKTRKVYLIGEGYFKVKHNPEKPFIVQTKYTRVTAYGTSFNVHAFKHSFENEVTLIKGTVAVDIKTANNTYKRVLTMKPGQHLEFNNNTDSVVIRNKNVEKYVAWKDGMLMFRNDPLSRVIQEMEMFYNVNFVVSDPKLYKYHFHATFEDETLFEALRLLKISSGIEYKICKREKNPDGSFKKRKIILYVKKQTILFNLDKNRMPMTKKLSS